MVNTQTRWPLPRAQTAQPERWRMRRRSKDPRRISVVEGRAAATFARALMIVSCFIYNNETIKNLFRQSLPEHLFQNCFASGGSCWLTTEIVPSSRAL